MIRRLIWIAAVGALVCGRLLADADPPDPNWIAGFWDDADFDDAILRATSTSILAETGTASALWPRRPAIRILSPDPERFGSSPARAPRPSRGPPLA